MKKTLTIIAVLIFMALPFAANFLDLFHFQTAPPPMDGDVYLLQPGTTLYGINRAINGGTGTEMWKLHGPYRDMVTFFWGIPNKGSGYVVLNMEGGNVAPLANFFKATEGKGNYVNIQTADQFRAYLKAGGWEKISTNDPALTGLKAALASGAPAAMVGYFASLSRMMPDVLIFPLTLIKTPAPEFY
jgi:hypothetical protein